MSYATPQNLIDQLGAREATALSDRSGTGQPDQARLADALANASDEVNGYVGRRYLLPLTSATNGQPVVPTLLTRLVVDIARYRLVGTQVMETDSIRNRFKDAVKVLEQISRGEISMGQLVLASAGGATPLGGSSAVRAGVKSFGDMSGVL